MKIKHVVTPLVLLFAATAVDALCNYGAVGICTFQQYQCPAGSRCRYLIPGAPIGLCCLERPDPRCPSPNMVGTCRFNMLGLTYNCMNNNDCTNNQVCCPDPCGGTCKDPIA